MHRVPAQPKIYHILHIDRLASVLAAGGLWCDTEMQRRGGGGTTIGMSRIKQRRLTLPVSCHPGDYVGDHVPFYSDSTGCDTSSTGCATAQLVLLKEEHDD
jgi:hypothetical protein